MLSHALLGALAEELVIVAFIGQQLITIRGGAKVVQSDNTWQCKAAAADKFKRLLGAVGGTEDKVTVKALTDPTQAHVLDGTIGAIVPVTKAEVVTVTGEETSLKRYRSWEKRERDKFT